MISRIISVLILCCLWAIPSKSQGFNQSYNFINTGTKGPGTSFANTNVTAFAISWNTTVTVSSCALQVDSSTDGVTWGSGDLIASQNCVTAGSATYATLASGKNFVRINVTSLVGNGSLNVTLTGIGGGGGGTANTADQAISPLNFNGDFKVRYESDCTFNSTTTVVCPSGNFTAADVNKIEFGTNAVQPHGSGSLITSPVIVPQGTITGFVNSTTVTVSIAATTNCTPSNNNLCWFAWGKQDDTTAIASAQTAAWNSGPCHVLQLPSGAAFVSAGGLGSTAGNSCTGSGDFGQVGPELAGMGKGATVIIPLPSFNFATCTNGTSATACFGGAPGLHAHDFQINGLGQTLNGTTHNNILLELDGGFACASLGATNLKIHDWGLMSTNLIGLEVQATCDATILNVTVQDFGNNLCAIVSGSGPGSNINLSGLACFGGNVGPSLTISGGTGNGNVSSTGGFYGAMLGAGNTNVAVNGNVTFNSSADVMFGGFSAGGENVLNLLSTPSSTTVVNLWGDLLTFLSANHSSTAQVIQAANSGAGSRVTMGQTQLVATGTNNRVFNTTSGNNIFDIGGNVFTNGSLANSILGSVFGTYSITGTPVTAAKLVLSAGWGTTAAWTALTGNTQYVTGTLTASGTGQLANPTITYTFPTPFLVAPTGCFALQVGGTQAAVANPFTPSTPTNTGVTFTYNGTPGAGSTLLVQIECWSM